MSKPIILSYGGGKQTVAMCVLVREGRLPRPERIIMADTGREFSKTFDYLEKYTRPMMREIGCEIEVVSHSYSRQDLFYEYADGTQRRLPTMPVFSRKDGRLSQLRNTCSGVWKRDAVIKYLREEERGYGRNNPVIQWLGFSRDEISRCKPSPRKWIENHFPLIMGYGVSLNRGECVQVVKDYGLPEPPKSRCYICPYQSNTEWQEVKNHSTDEWSKAIDLDFEIRERDEYKSVFLHRSGASLIDADLSEKRQPLFDYSQMECAEGCWV